MNESSLKPLIGVLASHDSQDKNEALATVLIEAHKDEGLRGILRRFRFVFTGGTYRRLFLGQPVSGQDPREVNHRLPEEVRCFLHDDCNLIILPPTMEGGVTVLASLVTTRKVSILWTFFSPLTTHLLYPENLALLRLADQWRVKKLMNSGSVKGWLRSEADRDACLNLQSRQFEISFGGDTKLIARPAEVGAHAPTVSPMRNGGSEVRLACDSERLSDQELSRATIALISHDEMKSRMLEFVIDYEHELEKFKCILATGTTGRLIADAVPRLRDKVCRYHSGPKGGDIEIATEILYHACDVVIFFVDPLHPHPHTEDIRVVFGACMIEDTVRMLSNEVQARAWMDRRVRGT